MSAFAATQIPKPADEQAFERACIVLWRCLLKDENVQRNGRRGQRQNGVDLYGVRNGEPSHLVGIQCKLKGPRQTLSETEVRDEFGKALTFSPPLVEYFIVTTSPDDVALQELARTLAAELTKTGRRLAFHVWGWNTLEERIGEHADALKAFDPTYGPFADRISSQLSNVETSQANLNAQIASGFSAVLSRLPTSGPVHPVVAPDDSGGVTDGADIALNAEIDGYRDLSSEGKPKTALALLERLWTRVKETASGKILFRIKANIGSCHLASGDELTAATFMLEAYDFAPGEPKAAANKVLALLLRREWKEAIAFGRSTLEADPSNESVANYVLQAAREDRDLDDPLQLIPDGIRATNQVQMGYAVFLRTRGRIPDWWNAARKALEAKPDDSFAQQYCAEADLDEVTRDEQFVRAGLLDNQKLEKASAATSVLRVAWNKIVQSEVARGSEAETTCCNFIVALRVTGNLGEAMDTARQALELKLNHPALLTLIAATAAEAREDDLLKSIVPRLPDSSDGLMIRFKFYAAEGNWSEVSKFDADLIDRMPEAERPTVRVAVKLAAARLNPPEQIERTLDALSAEIEGNARAAILLAETAKSLGFEQIALEAFEQAVSDIKKESHIADRQMVAIFAAGLGKWSVVADVLDGHVSESIESDELEALATAFSNDLPIRQRALKFFERLPKEVAQKAFYLRAAGIVHFNRGDLSEAEALLRKSVDADPTDVRTLTTLFSTLQRRGSAADMEAVLEKIDVRRLVGPARQKIFLAQILQGTARGQEALDYAYEVLKAAPNDGNAFLAYFGLIISTEAGSLIPRGDTAAVDYWIRLEALDGEKYDFLIEANPDASSETALSPTHPIAALVVGRKVGETFEQPLPVGPAKVWRLVEVKHKYLHILHRGLEHFEARFPDSKGLYRVPVETGNIAPILNEVRERADRSRSLADVYLEQHLPLSMVGDRLGGNVLAFAEYVRSIGGSIVACVGTEPERRAALELISRSRETGAVLDAYTAWVASELGVLDVLKSLFGTLQIPRSAIDEYLIVEEEARNQGKESMSVGWHNNQFVREAHSAEENAARALRIGERRLDIERHCNIQPVTIPDSKTQLATVVTENFGAQSLDAAYLAVDRVLISDDLYYRHVALEACKANGVWLQAALIFARDDGIIDQQRYADAVAELAIRRHEYLTLNVPTLLDVLKSDDTDGLRKFDALCNSIGAKNGDIASHILIVEHALRQLWTLLDFPYLKQAKATSILLEKLIRFQSDNWAIVLAQIFASSSQALRRYLRQWIRGHFLPAEKISEGLRAMGSQQ